MAAVEDSNVRRINLVAVAQPDAADTGAGEYPARLQEHQSKYWQQYGRNRPIDNEGYRKENEMRRTERTKERNAVSERLSSHDSTLSAPPKVKEKVGR